MSAVPRFSLTPDIRAALDRIAAEVEIEHELRMDVCDTIPLIPRGRRARKRPRTAIISRAAAEAVEKRGTSLAFQKFLRGKRQ